MYTSATHAGTNSVKEKHSYCTQQQKEINPGISYTFELFRLTSLHVQMNMYWNSMLSAKI